MFPSCTVIEAILSKQQLSNDFPLPQTHLMNILFVKIHPYF